MKDITPIDDIEKQLNKVFGSLGSCYSTKISFILSKLDLSPLSPEIERCIFSPEALIKLYLFKRVKGISVYSKLEEHFNQNKNEALNLGFYKDVNNNLSFPSKRNYNHFLQTKLTKEDINLLDNIAEMILSLATKNNLILDIDIVKKVINDHKSKIREQNRVFKETVKLIRKLVYPLINIKIKNNGKFTTKDLLDVLVYTAYTHSFVNNGSNVFSFEKDKEFPSGDLIMYHFNKIDSIQEVRETFENILDVIINFAKKNYNILQRRKLPIAYDIHKVPFYGKKIDFVNNGKSEVGTTQFFEFLTCSIVVAGKRFAVDVVPIHPLDDVTDLIDYSLSKVKRRIHIERVLLDRGFDNSKVINTIKKHNLKFIMPKVRTATVKAWFDKSEDCKARIINDFKIGKGENEASANLVLVNDKEGLMRAFITNLDIPVQLAHYLYSWYGKRWGIETSYRQMDYDFLARTTSNNYIIRIFYFLFSVCLFNLWVLVNICVSLTLYGRVSEKPIITAKLFAVALYKVQEEYVDPGG